MTDISTGGKPVAVVIDGYSAGNFFPAAFKARGAHIIHVQSTAEPIPTMLAPNLADYAENIVETDPDRLVERLRPYAPVCVIAGQESSVLLADQISERLGVASNGTALSPARRDKYEMIEALRRAGVRCARQLKSGDPAELLAWADDNGSYPVVIKPLSSAATDGVFICHDRAEVAAAAATVFAARDIFGMANTEVLIQSYLAGTEYIVDTVCSDGHRYVVGIWEYEKTLLPSGKNIYDKDILVDPDSDPAPALVSYIDQVLAAIGIRWGACHAEVIVTPDGPTLVEIGARLNGNMDPGFHDVCLGDNQAALTARAYLDPAGFAAELGGRVYSKLQPAVVYNAPTTLDGTVTEVDQTAVDEIRNLKSVHLASVKLKPGGRIRPTIDLLTSPLRVFLTAASQEQLMADYAEVRRWKDSVYRVG